jgi:hypothetical protein
MPCKRCANNKLAAQARREALLKKQERDYRKRCDQGDTWSCMQLQKLMATEHYKRSRFKSELHFDGGS